MKHLATHGIPVPDPQADAQGTILHTPARQAGGARQPPAGTAPPGAGHRAMLRSSATCWRACTWPGVDFELAQPNLRGLRLVERDGAGDRAVPRRRQQRELIESELAFQQQVAASAAYAGLPDRADPRRPVPRQRDVRRRRRARSARRLLRLLLRRRRPLRLRHRGVPERLVHRPGHRRARGAACAGLRRRLRRGAQPDAPTSCGCCRR